MAAGATSRLISGTQGSGGNARASRDWKGAICRGRYAFGARPIPTLDRAVLF